MLHIQLRVIEAHLRQGSGASAQTCFGAVSFTHRFSDVPQSVRFRTAAALTSEAVAAIAEHVRILVLRLFARRGPLDSDDASDTLSWANSGFSVGAWARIANQAEPT